MLRAFCKPMAQGYIVTLTEDGRVVWFLTCRYRQQADRISNQLAAEIGAGLGKHSLCIAADL